VAEEPDVVFGEQILQDPAELEQLLTG